MSRLETALHAGQWELAAHVLVFAALHTLSHEHTAGEQRKEGGYSDGGKRQRRKRQAQRR